MHYRVGVQSGAHRFPARPGLVMRDRQPCSCNDREVHHVVNTALIHVVNPQVRGGLCAHQAETQETFLNNVKYKLHCGVQLPR